MSTEIPIQEAGTSFTQTVDLDGSDFVFVFRWNDREQRWYLGITDTDDTPIFMGRKLVADWLTLKPLVDQTLRPRGELLVVDTTGGGLDPRIGDLGNRVRLLYFNEAEIAALG